LSQLYSILFLRIDNWIIWLIIISFIAFIAISIVWGIRAHRKPVSAGREDLVGRTAVVSTDLNPQGIVLVQGELWRAILDKGGAEPEDEGTDLKMRGIDVPPEYWETEPQERLERIKRNMRAILQFFNIKVFVYPDRVEIRGAIPPQVMTQVEPEDPDAIAPIIKSARGRKGMGSLD